MQIKHAERIAKIQQGIDPGDESSNTSDANPDVSTALDMTVGSRHSNPVAAQARPLMKDIKPQIYIRVNLR